MKLGVHEFEKWIHAELNGYADGEQIPPYRETQGEVKAFNPYHGWQPIHFEDPKMQTVVSTRHCNQSVGELETLVHSAQGGGTLSMDFTAQQQMLLQKAIHMDLEITLIVQLSSVTRILDTVRTTILQWALKLEADGIQGQGMTFTKDEKKWPIEQHIRSTSLDQFCTRRFNMGPKVLFKFRPPAWTFQSFVSSSPP